MKPPSSSIPIALFPVATAKIPEDLPGSLTNSKKPTRAKTNPNTKTRKVTPTPNRTEVNAQKTSLPLPLPLPQQHQRHSSPPSDSSDLGSLSGLSSDEADNESKSTRQIDTQIDKTNSRKDQTKSGGGEDTDGEEQTTGGEGASQEQRNAANTAVRQDGDSEVPDKSVDIKQEETTLKPDDHNTKEKRLREQLGLSDSGESDASSSSTPSPRPSPAQKPKQPQQIPKHSKPQDNNIAASTRQKSNGKPNLSRPLHTKYTKSTTKPLPPHDEATQPRARSYPYAHDELEAFMKQQAKRREQQRKVELNVKKAERKGHVDKMNELDKNTKRVLTQHLRSKRPKRSSPPRLPPHPATQTTPLSQRMILGDDDDTHLHLALLDDNFDTMKVQKEENEEKKEKA